ncbi:heavy-metal-associated domain-containing protein [Nocardia bovistercoris]|uniref:Heavy-metal-associated domain-containing protein n=1 Tax=Nocardia bovistercoris TaxID=2785916 RepID=A0A931I923_9NOCA|nr:copper ion binding protein [Nocardia bovistercoris]MBH0776100.1 heavy-metal-associated domain-containing protein [Nocardia bovistercoris]
MATSTYTVKGMTCGHCAGSVREEIGRIAGVTGVEVDLDTGAVRVESTAPVSDAEIAAAVDEAGYEVAV